ncbi:ubiquitin-like domain-containing protein [Streptomyces sp. NPDC052092]|uniref:ubiquitin-like domain-containing protein n=1 Tax=Streptomyces sp. NPDC052092 TaxID=3365685 RepID=UPI0037CF8253
MSTTLRFETYEKTCPTHAVCGGIHEAETVPALPRRAPAPAPPRRSAHRRPGRYAERADAARRLLPRALVVAFLAGGTTAFVAEDKAVELNVDGRPRTLHTFADDVTALLAEEGVRTGPYDEIVPAPGTALEDGDAIEVRRARPLLLTLDGTRQEVWTTAETVREALERIGVRVSGARMSVPPGRRIGPAGLALDVRTERAVTVLADGRARTVRTNAATVREAVTQAGITLRGRDTTSVAPGSFPRDGQTVTVLRITDGTEVRDEAIPFTEVRVEDPALTRGAEVVDRPGRQGLRRLTYAQRTVNGVRQKPRLLGTEVVRDPLPRRVRVGTRPVPPSVRGADALDWDALARCESGGRPDATDPSGTYGGLYQFDTRTWQDLGGTGRPQDAPAAEQTHRAKKLYVSSGAAAWPHCGTRLEG